MNALEQKLQIFRYKRYCIQHAASLMQHIKDSCITSGNADILPVSYCKLQTCILPYTCLVTYIPFIYVNICNTLHNFNYQILTLTTCIYLCYNNNRANYHRLPVHNNNIFVSCVAEFCEHVIAKPGEEVNSDNSISVSDTDDDVPGYVFE